MWVSNKVPSNLPKDIGYRVSNPKPKKGKGTSSPTEKPTCGKCGKKHYGCCKRGHKVRDIPNLRGQDKGSGQSQSCGSNEAPKKNHFYALRSRGEQETSPDLVTGMFQVFSIDVYALLDPVLLYPCYSYSSQKV